jgi:hypothetical protein
VNGYCFFVWRLAREYNYLNYLLYDNIPRKFSALPTVGYGMYAPELQGNSDEFKVAIAD